MGGADKMKRVVYSFVLFFLGLFLFLAPFAKAQGTYTAASPAYHDVNACINSDSAGSCSPSRHTAVNGDTIIIPAGSATWASGQKLVVPTGIGITITGTGTPNSTPTTMGASSSCTQTQITWPFGGGFISMSPTFGNSTSRISCMQFTSTTGTNGSPPPIGVTGTCTSSGCPNYRLDNMTIPTAQICLASDATFANVANMFGVADHNTMGDTAPGCNPVLINVGHGNWLGVGSWGDNSWSSPDTMGAPGTPANPTSLSGGAFYLENNVLDYTLGTDTDIFAPGGGGARIVCRFNTFNNINTGGVCSGHGTETTGRPRGVVQWEGYANTGTCSNGSQGCGSAWPGRSGHGMSFGNSFSNIAGGFFKGLADLNAQRVFRDVGVWGTCDGVGPATNAVPGAPAGSLSWDSTDGTVYYSGTIGSVSGAGGFVVTDSGSSGFTSNQWVSPSFVYEFLDTTLSAGIGIITANTSNTLTTGFCGPCNTPAAGHTYQIRKVTACLDQAARSNGSLMAGNYSSVAPYSYPYLVGTGSSGPINQAIDPIYEADDTLPSTADHTIGSDQGSLFVANRDWYAESVHQPAQTSPTSPFNGTSGSGHGTLANRPTTCSPHVGYWATDQGDWNQSGSGQQGELFVCTATNTWSIYYEPYTYPHPIIASATTSGNSPSPPTGLSVTVH